MALHRRGGKSIPSAYRFGRRDANGGGTNTMITSVTVSDESKFSVGNSGTSDGRLNPGGQATRAETAAMLKRYLEK